MPIPRVDHVSRTDNAFAFMWTRRQSPVRPALAMTINEAQGQALECAGVWLADPCFTHGQLYVAASRVDHPSRVDGITRNVGYREVLSYAAGEGGGGYGARRGRDEWGRRASGGRRRWLACAVVAVLGAALGAGWTTWRARRSARARARGRRFGCVNSKRAQRVRAGRARWD